MIDSHAHIISEFYDDIEGVIEESKKNNLINVINCADSINTSKEVITLYKKSNCFLLPAIGIHPENVNENIYIDDLENLIKNNKIFAIGEIGLDYHYSKENKEEQKKLFIKQLDLAKKYNLPVIVHIRDAIQDAYDILKKYNLKGVIHCYSGSYEMAKEFIKLGYYLGIGGVLTFKNSKLGELIEKIDINKIIIETDSPFLSPEPHRGEKNKPSNVFYVAQKLANIKHIDIEKIIVITTKNVNDIFDIK